MPVTIDGTNGITQLPSSQGLINIVASRPESPSNGTIIWNTGTNVLETFVGTGWSTLASQSYSVQYLIVAGGGGGTGNPGYVPKAGGSGVVIIRYSGNQRGTGGTVNTANGYTTHTFTSSGNFVA